jgi:3'-5' exoribonuclease
MELETVTRAIDKIAGFPSPLKTVVQHLLISHHGQYEFGSPKLPMIREAMVFHYLDDLDSKLAAVRVALATPSGDDEWSAYSNALGRKFLKLEEFLEPTPSAAESKQAAQPKPQAAKSTPAAAGAPGSGSAPTKSEEPGFLRRLFS